MKNIDKSKFPHSLFPKKKQPISQIRSISFCSFFWGIDSRPSPTGFFLGGKGGSADGGWEKYCLFSATKKTNDGFFSLSHAKETITICIFLRGNRVCGTGLNMKNNNEKLYAAAVKNLMYSKEEEIFTLHSIWEGIGSAWKRHFDAAADGNTTTKPSNEKWMSVFDRKGKQIWLSNFRINPPPS